MMAGLGKALPPLILVLVSLAPLVYRPQIYQERDRGAPGSSPVSPAARDVIVLVLQFPPGSGDALSGQSLQMISGIDAAIGQMEGIRGFSSLADATVVRAEQDEILVMPFLPPALINAYDPR